LRKILQTNYPVKKFLSGNEGLISWSHKAPPSSSGRGRGRDKKGREQAASLIYAFSVPKIISVTPEKPVVNP
jgi:hypothetical protein